MLVTDQSWTVIATENTENTVICSSRGLISLDVDWTFGGMIMEYLES